MTFLSRTFSLVSKFLIRLKTLNHAKFCHSLQWCNCLLGILFVHNFWQHCQQLSHLKKVGQGYNYLAEQKQFWVTHNRDINLLNLTNVYITFECQIKSFSFSDEYSIFFNNSPNHGTYFLDWYLNFFLKSKTYLYRRDTPMIPFS